MTRADSGAEDVGDRTGRATLPGPAWVSAGGATATAAAALAWVVMLGAILRHRVYVSHDTMISYAHVWYVSERLRHGHGIPLHMPVVGHGHGFAFPYGLLPWLTAAFLWPVLGEWGVTLWFVVGAVAVILATFAAFPELRRHWWAAAVLVNPLLVAAPVIGQMPFLWATALLLGAVALWRRGRRVPAVVLAALAQVTHPAVLMPITAGLVAGWLPWEADRRALLRAYVVSALVALPAALLVYASPVFQEASLATKLTNFAGTVLARGVVVAVPVALVALRRTGRQWPAVAAVVLLLLANVAVIGPLGGRYAWGALRRQPNETMLVVARRTGVVRGATYRVLRAGDGKVGTYQLMRLGARLDSEFFPESIDRRSFAGQEAYSAFLRRRRVDFVMVWATYDRKFRTNEHALLDRMSHVAAPTACDGSLVGVAEVAHERSAFLYAVRRGCPATSSTAASSASTTSDASRSVMSE